MFASGQLQIGLRDDVQWSKRHDKEIRDGSQTTTATPTEKRPNIVTNLTTRLLNAALIYGTLAKATHHSKKFHAATDRNKK